MQTPVYAGYEAIEDDVHAVRKRAPSRLWFRAAPLGIASADPAVPAAHGHPAKTLEHPGTDELATEAARLDVIHTIMGSTAHEPARAVEAAAVPVAWRTIQPGAPVFLLSSNPLLGSGRPGPILGPGMSYRITSVAGSVVGLEVMHSNGDTRCGYANAVDLRCIDPTIQTGELEPDEKGITSRLRLTRLANSTLGLLGG